MEFEKIKIYVTKRVAEILEKDAETFEFLKKDGIMPNKNAFLSQLVLNYWEYHKQKQLELYDSVKYTIKSNSYLDENKTKNLTNLIIGKINKEIASDLADKFDSTISFKPTKETESIISYINEYLLFNSSLSEYFRNMFVAYSTLPQDMREQIIFKNHYNNILLAIKNKKNLFITLNDNKRTRIEISPYSFARSKEEIHIYLLCKHSTACKSIKLSKIQSATIIDKDAVFNEEEESLFKKMAKYGPQFFYTFNEKDIIVRLTKKGKQLYHKIYVHRPIPENIENDKLTFKCSYSQIVQYFSRFGGEVEIISPKEVHEMIYNYHNAYILKSTKNSLNNDNN